MAGCCWSAGGIEVAEMIETRGVVHFTISVSDPERSAAFYEDILGLKVVQKIPGVGMVFLSCGDDYIILTRTFGITSTTPTAT